MGRVRGFVFWVVCNSCGARSLRLSPFASATISQFTGVAIALQLGDVSLPRRSQLRNGWREVSPWPVLQHRTCAIIKKRGTSTAE